MANATRKHNFMDETVILVGILGYSLTDESQGRTEEGAWGRNHGKMLFTFCLKMCLIGFLT